MLHALGAKVDHCHDVVQTHPSSELTTNNVMEISHKVMPMPEPGIA